MTAVQIVALVLLPFGWMLLADAPSRNAIRRMRRNERRGGLPADVAFDKWMMRNGRLTETIDYLRRTSPEDQAAFALVISVAEEISAAIEQGEAYSVATARIVPKHVTSWAAHRDPCIDPDPANWLFARFGGSGCKEVACPHTVARVRS